MKLQFFKNLKKSVTEGGGGGGGIIGKKKNTYTVGYPKLKY
jgi:hypothetical protein